MNESEYIYATNLAKVRSARSVLLDITPMSAKEVAAENSAHRALDILESIYKDKAAVTEFEAEAK